MVSGNGICWGMIYVYISHCHLYNFNIGHIRVLFTIDSLNLKMYHQPKKVSQKKKISKKTELSWNLKINPWLKKKVSRNFFKVWLFLHLNCVARFKKRLMIFFPALWSNMSVSNTLETNQSLLSVVGGHWPNIKTVTLLPSCWWYIDILAVGPLSGF